MALAQDPSDTPVLDEWIAQVGEHGVVAAVEDTKRRIADGTLTGFYDRETFLDYVMRGRQQSA